MRRVALAIALLWALPLSTAVAAPPADRLPAPVYRTAATVANGRVYVLGGHDTAGGTVSDVDVFDPATRRARRAGTLALPTHGAAVATLAGRVLVFGGASATVHDTVQQFVPSTGRTRVVGRLPAPRADVTAVVVGKRAILVGGFDGYGPQSAVWATADGRRFRVVAHLPQAVRYPAVAAVGNAVYVLGGLVSGGEYSGTFSDAIQRIWLPTGTAHVVGRLPTPLAHAAAAAAGGRIYVLGGSAPGGPSAAILRFDPKTRRLARAGRLPHPVTDAAVATVGRTTYLLGGISTAPLATVLRAHL